MTIDLTGAETEMILSALKEHAHKREESGATDNELYELVTRLEVLERQSREFVLP